jgi:hypothetical protein
LIAAGGSGRSTSLIPAVPAAWSVATIAFMELSPRSSSRVGKIASMGACRSPTNADHRLPDDPLARIGGADGVVEGLDHADIRPPSFTRLP